MNLQQLRILREAQRQHFSLTAVADALGGSQSGISRSIKELEEELGYEIYIRKGKRLLGLTETGAAITAHACQALLSIENIQRAGDAFSARETGRLVLATTHTQARYSLPELIKDFRERFPKVQLVLRQASPPEVARLLESGEADLGIATESLRQHRELVCLPFFKWYHGVVVPDAHPLAGASRRGEPLTLKALAAEPIVTYQEGFTGRTAIDRTFHKAHLHPDVVLEALDADVIKAYVRIGLGVGIVASVAYDPDSDQGLTLIDGSELFPENTTVLALRRGRMLPGYVLYFARLCLRQQTEEQILQEVMS